MSPAQAAPLNPRTAFGRNTRTLLWIDRYGGVAICLILTLFRRILGRDASPLRLRSGQARRPGDVPPSCRSILFLKLAEQGSTVLAYEALRSAVEKVGRENVYFLAFEENRFVVDILELMPAENVLTIRTASPWTMAASAVQRLREIRRRRIDACIDMEFFTRSSAALAFLTGSRRRVGFHAYFGEGPWRGDLFTHRVLYNPHLHTSQIFATLVRALDVPPERLPTFDFVPAPLSAPPPFRSAPEEVKEVRALLRGAGMPEQARLILLNANASDLLPLRRWDRQNYLELARRLLAEFPDLCLGFTGAPEEQGAISSLVEALGSTRCLCLAGRTSLRQLFVLYGLAEVLVTNDSGPAHFASLTSVDVVTLFGPETPLLFAGLGPRNHPLWAGLACSPCVNALNNRQTACRDNVCMQRISVEQVFHLTREIYRRRLSLSP